MLLCGRVIVFPGTVPNPSLRPDTWELPSPEMLRSVRRVPSLFPSHCPSIHLAEPFQMQVQASKTVQHTASGSAFHESRARRASSEQLLLPALRWKIAQSIGMSEGHSLGLYPRSPTSTRPAFCNARVSIQANTEYEDNSS